MVWDFEKSENVKYKIANKPIRYCAFCGHELYDKHKRRSSNALKGHYINEYTRYNMYRSESVILGPNQKMCITCKNKSDDNKHCKYFKSYDVECPSFINNILNNHEKILKNYENDMNKKQPLLQPDKLNNKQFKGCCGLTKNNIFHITDRLKEENNIQINMIHLFIACTVWFNNISYVFAAILFGFKSKSGIQYAIDSTIDELSKHWVPKYIGYPAWTVNKIIQNIPDFVRILFPNKLVLGCIDATYLYSEKSYYNYQYQKMTYSNHKHLNLQKEHVFCDCNGKIILVNGPYPADGSNNDSTIWQTIQSDLSHELYDIVGVNDSTREKYAITADRGYKGVKDDPKYPELLFTSGVKSIVKVSRGDAKQLSTQQANSSRHLRLYLYLCIFISACIRALQKCI